ncbi:MAG: hypothetical protein K2Y25_16775 [Pseudomonadaceae bacterium]|nr:hypothetical protein [Pseudomonadaceae bacterium]
MALPGLHLQLDSLPAQHTQRTAAQLLQEQAEQQQHLASLSLQLQTAEQIEAAKRRKDELARERNKIEQKLAAFDELQALRTSHLEREEQTQELQLQREQLEDRLAAVGDEEERLRLSLHEHNAQLSSLDDQHRSICQLREARNDSAQLFTYLHELPRHEWLAATELSLSALANTLKEYQKDCERLTRLEELARTAVSELHVGGLNKYQQSENRDSEIRRAKTLLIRESEARAGLRVEHLFRLSFIVGKEGQKSEAFADIDGAASNGTVLMAKLVTGLALLHQMQDKRHRVRSACYLDEALALDGPNQTSLIETAAEFGFALIFASPAPLATARYCVPISRHNGQNQISQKSWQILEPKEPGVFA